MTHRLEPYFVVRPESMQGFEPNSFLFSEESLVARMERAIAVDLPYVDGREESRVAVELGSIRKMGRKSAVLMLFGFSEHYDSAAILLTKRTEKVEKHKGQIAFPGGMVEPGEDEQSAAVREAHEEVGISAKLLRMLGAMPPLPTLSSGFMVRPFVALLQKRVEEVVLHTSVNEIAEAFWIPVTQLVREGVYRREPIEWQGHHFYTDTFSVDGKRIWGATGMMLKNLLERLQTTANVL